MTNKTQTKVDDSIKDAPDCAIFVQDSSTIVLVWLLQRAVLQQNPHSDIVNLPLGYSVLHFDEEQDSCVLLVSLLNVICNRELFQLQL